MTKDTRINVLNIGLMLMSCAAAFIMPFEVFLFAYAFLGPLHYLTEISWLHDRQYFSKGKYDYLVLLIIGILITWDYLAYQNQLWPYHDPETAYSKVISLKISDKFLLLALFGSVIMAFVKNIPIKLISLFLLFALINNWIRPTLDAEGNPVQSRESTIMYILTSFVPTLIHVYLFTGLFMLYGALKTRSKSGLWSVLVFVICPLLLITLFRDQHFVQVSSYGMKAYGTPDGPDGFFDLSKSILNRFMGLQANSAGMSNHAAAQQQLDAQWIQFVYYSQAGILLMRFIAFAYLYHYLNWFSKTEVIRWHQIPKARFAVIIFLWIASVSIYAVDYSKGLQWLFFLSFSHVLLEFPLNMVSIVGIGKEAGSIFKNGFSLKRAEAGS